MVVWLTPAIIVFLPKGNSNLNNFASQYYRKNQLLQQVHFGTCRIPKFVKRTVGGKAKITEAKTPGTIPIPKNATAGIK